MPLPFSPQLLEMAMARLGVAARQLEGIETETKKAMFRFLIQALHSGDANAYIKEAMAYIDERDARAAAPPPPPPRPEPQPNYRGWTRPLTERKR